jgi:hypothetical protein
LIEPVTTKLVKLLLIELIHLTTKCPPLEHRDLFFFNGTSDFFESKEKCESYGMAIASIESYSEAQDIFNAVVKVTETAWVGLVRTPNSSTYENLNGKIVDIPWAKGEPNNAKGNENCLMISKHLNGYNDDPCDQAWNVICEQIEEEFEYYE